MRNNPDYYDFDGIRLFLTDNHIEILSSGKTFSPSKNHRQFLISLARQYPDTITYEELLREVWQSDNFNESALKKIQETKRTLVKWLKSVGVQNPGIVADGGYRLDGPVVPGYLDTAQDERSIRIKGSYLKWLPAFLLLILLSTVFLAWGYDFFFGLQRDEISGRNSASKTKDSNRQIEESSNEQIDQPVLKINNIEIISAPVPGKEFLVHIKGENINPETIRLRVVGPGCGGDDPCTVPNGALRLYGKVRETEIEKAPLRLGQGEYKIWLENSSVTVSNQLTISIPATKP